MPEIVYIIGSTPVERNHILVVLAGEPVHRGLRLRGAVFRPSRRIPSGCIVVPVDLPGMGLRGLIKEILAGIFRLRSWSSDAVPTSPTALN